MRVAKGREENRRETSEPAKAQAYDLSEMLQQITPEVLHAPIDFGKPVGKEIW
ncbi:MAG: hypothetical protein H3C28_09940 [Sphingomonadales bacterium]|nr:hypothetical protein [Sphingomonadales bacterium]